MTRGCRVHSWHRKQYPYGNCHKNFSKQKNKLLFKQKVNITVADSSVSEVQRTDHQKKKKIQQKQRTKTKGIANLPSAPTMYENKRELSKTKQYKKVLNKKVSFETRRKLCLPKPWSCFPCLCCDVTGASESCWGPVPFYATEFNLSTSLPRVSRELA